MSAGPSPDDRELGVSDADLPSRRPAAAGFAWLLLAVTAGCLAALGSEEVAAQVVRALRTSVTPWGVAVAALATAGLPGVDEAVERVWTRCALLAALLGHATLLLVGLLDRLGPDSGLRVAATVALFPLGGGWLLATGVAALLWLSFAFEVARLPRRELDDEWGRVMHVAAPAVAVVLHRCYGLPAPEWTPDLVVVTPRTAMAGTFTAILFGLALWLRLRRPREAE